MDNLQKAEASGVPGVVLEGLRLAAGTKPAEVGPTLVEAWKDSEPGAWSWDAISEHLADKRKTRDLVVVYQLLEGPRSPQTEAALRTALAR